ncbi:FUSC family protein [Paenibacillus mendelii]|uniref:Aromatic acid exporter family protein n=1 Tax=Paenibacillus mendelii TaxID=206163 RepID=A0ABV6JD96_9BACL|nr:aromatic acid exporter family protein [Paenibacillus mendelii]MCQ6562485.1 aromatic acid exporter family protein [Paenibacillus mendelii]
MTIGARVLKTGLAVALAVFVSGLIGFASPIIATVAAIFTIQPSISRSWQQVSDQLQTNVLGAVVALIAVKLFGHTAIAVGLVCIIVILISIRLRMESTIGLTLVTVVAVMEATGGEGWVFALQRFSMVLTGMGAAFLVNLLVFPPRPRKQFTEQVHEAYAELSLLLRMAISNELREDVHRNEKDKLHRTLRKLEERYTLFEEERTLRASRKLIKARQLLLSKQLIKTLQQGADLLDVVEEHYFAAPEASKWASRFDRQIEDLTKYHEQILLKIEGKVKQGAIFEPEEERETRLAMQLTDYLVEDSDDRKRLVFVASAIFEYSYHLRRLERLSDQVMQRDAEADGKPAGKSESVPEH